MKKRNMQIIYELESKLNVADEPPNISAVTVSPRAVSVPLQHKNRGFGLVLLTVTALPNRNLS